MKTPSKTEKKPAQLAGGLTRRKLLEGSTLSLAGVALNAGARSLPTNSEVLDVVIIGAGLAGLTAARDLQSAGCDSFVVLESRDRVGGRTFNHDLGNGVISEAGGQWIGPGQTAIADLARELSVGTFSTFYQGKTCFLAGNLRVLQDLKGGVGASGTIPDKLSAMARNVPSDAPWQAQNAKELDKLSLGEWIAQQNPNPEEKFSASLAAQLTFGVPPGKLGLLQYLSMLHSANNSYHNLESIKDGAQETRFIGGSQRLCIKMADSLGEKVRKACPVRKISNWDRDIVELHTDQGVLRTRHVIAAINPALCQQITFDPPLPDGRAQLQKRWPAHAPMRKTVHVYSKPFWRDAGLNGQIMPLDDGPLLWSYDNSPPDASFGVLSAFVRPGGLSSNPKDAERQLNAIYVRALGEHAQSPLQFHDFDWGKVDPWSLTCIHPIPPGFWTTWGSFLRPPVGRIIWSGTETADLWAGSMDGAVRSGRRAALQIAAVLGR